MYELLCLPPRPRLAEAGFLLDDVFWKNWLARSCGPFFPTRGGRNQQVGRGLGWTAGAQLPTSWVTQRAGLSWSELTREKTKQGHETHARPVLGPELGHTQTLGSVHAAIAERRCSPSLSYSSDARLRAGNYPHPDTAHWALCLGWNPGPVGRAGLCSCL